MEAAHLLPATDVLRHFSVTAEGGLSAAQVTGARERYGPNGERAGRAGERGPRAPQSQFPLLPPHPALGGQEARAPEASSDAPGAPGGAARPPSRARGLGAGGWGRVPAGETGRLAPSARSSRTSHLHPAPSTLEALFHPILDRIPPPTPRLSAGIVQVQR